MVGYYAQGEVAPEAYRYSYRGENLAWSLGQMKPAPDVLLLWARDGDRETAPQWQALLDTHPEWGLCRLPADQLPKDCRGVLELVVAVRKGLLERPPEKSPLP